MAKANLIKWWASGTFTLYITDEKKIQILHNLQPINVNV